MNTPSRRWLAIAFAVYAASTLISQAVMSIGAAILGGAILFSFGGPRGVWRAFQAEWQDKFSRRYLQFSMLLLTACALSLIVGMLAPLGWGGKFIEPQFFNDMAKSWYFFWALILVLGLKRLNESERTLVVRVWIIAFASVSAIGVLQYFTGWPRPQVIPSNPSRYHATVFLGHHLSVASILIFPFFACLDFLKESFSGKSVLGRKTLMFCAMLGFSALFLTYSRMLWVALPLGLVLWAVHALPRKKALAVVGAMLAIGAGVTRLPAIHSRLFDVLGTGDRQKLWKANLEFLRLRPLTGTGFRRNIDASSYYLESLPNDGYVFTGHAHNNFIDMLGGTGILGAAAWLLWCAGVFWLLRAALRQKRRPPDFAWGLVCAWFVFQLNGLTQVNFWEGKVMHQMVWAVAWSLFWVSRASTPDLRLGETA